MKRRLGVVMLLVGAAVLATAGVASYLAYEASQAVPEFYQQAVVVTLDEQREAGEKFELQVIELHNEARQTGRWTATFTEDAINGWLAADLPAKFPGLLPAALQDPRVSVRNRRLEIGCRYTEGAVTTVFSMELEPSLATSPNELAVRVRRVRAGLLPVPTRQLVERATKAAAKVELPLAWNLDQDVPVATFSLPTDRRELFRPGVVLESLELVDGAIVVSGRTESEAGQPAIDGR